MTFPSGQGNLYVDYQNGKLGVNTSQSRGADTFHPFNNIDGRTLLWTNPSPGAYHDAFSVTADFSKYSLFEINATYSVYGGTPASICKNIVLRNETKSIGAGTTVFNPYTFGRTVSISDTQIAFGVGTTSDGVGAYYCVPQNIYGVC